jgi:starvation-inducible DNA-binding protein
MVDAAVRGRVLVWQTPRLTHRRDAVIESNATSSMLEETMYETRNDLQESSRKGVVQLLNDRLAEAIDLQLQAKHAHWNVKGPNFVGLHDLFDRVAGSALEYVDLIAERGVALGGVAEGTIQTVSQRSKLPAYAAGSGDWTAHVEAMRTALATFGRSARRAIDEATDLKDADTADLFTEVSRGIDKLLWMVEAHVQK